MRKKNRSKNKDLLLLLAAVARARKQARKHSTITCPTYPAPTFQVPIPVTSRHVNLRPVSLVINSSRFPLLISPHLQPSPPPSHQRCQKQPPIHPSYPPNSRIPRTQPPPGGTVHSIPFHSFSRPAYMQLSHNHPLLDLPIIACEKKSRCGVSVGGMYRKKKKKKKRSQKKKKVRVINFY